MKIKQIIALLPLPVLMFIGILSMIPVTASAAQDETTWQRFVRQKCGGSSADSATQCASSLERRLRQKCGSADREADSKQRYIECWRQFIRSNGGTAGENSSPYERERQRGGGDNNDGGQSWADGDGCGGADTAIIKCDADNSGEVESNGIWAILIMVINVMTAGVGVLAVAGIVYGSILYTTAGDKADQVKKATDIITNVVIGLVAFALMWAGLNFLIPGGVFS